MTAARSAEPEKKNLDISIHTYRYCQKLVNQFASSGRKHTKLEICEIWGARSANYKLRIAVNLWRKKKQLPIFHWFPPFNLSLAVNRFNRYRSIAGRLFNIEGAYFISFLLWGLVVSSLDFCHLFWVTFSTGKLTTDDWGEVCVCFVLLMTFICTFRFFFLFCHQFKTITVKKLFIFFGFYSRICRNTSVCEDRDGKGSFLYCKFYKFSNFVGAIF